MPKNVLTNFNCWRYYVKRPWKLFQDIRCNIHHAWQRTTKGYCDLDWMNMDHWFIATIPPMLRDMANNGMAYPSGEVFNSKEKWHDWLYHQAYELEQCTEEAQEKQNEYYEAWYEQIQKDPFERSVGFEKINENFFARSDQIYKESQERLKKVFTELGKHFYCLWD